MDSDDALAVGTELENAVALRVGYPKPEDHRTVGVCEALELLAETVPVEDVVAQDEGDRVVGDELLTDEEGVSQAARLGLLGVAEGAPPLRSVAQQG